MLKPGDTFDRYVVEALLGEGGMGQVHRAWDAKLQRRVALKVVRTTGEGTVRSEGVMSGADGPASDARTLREARAAAAFDHPNAVSVFDVGTYEGTTYIAMELVEGRTLRTFIGDRSIPIARRIGWLLDVARALEAAHRRGLVHRDVKPENVMLRDDGVIKVLDFGIARRVELHVDPVGATATPGSSPGPGTITGSGTIVGTPFYMPPEQMRGEAIDGRADQFAWGVLGYELLVGRLPWGVQRDALMTIASMFTASPPSLRSLDPDVPEPIDEAVLRAIERDRDRRFASMGELLAAMDTPISERVSQRFSRAPVSVPPRSRAPLVAVIGLAAATIAVFFGVRAMRPSAVSPTPSSSSVAVSSSSSALLASSSAITILDLEKPTSTHAGAVAAYLDGMRASHDGNYALAQRSFATAVAIDPDLAAAQLRVALSTVTAPLATTARDALAAAGRHRDSLDARDAAFLDAFSPLVLDQDAHLAAERFAKLAVERPNDAEIAQMLAWLYQLEYRFDDALVQSERALRLDPQYVGALGNEEITYIALGKADEAIAIAKRCTERVGMGADCLRLEALVHNAMGDCDAAEHVAESLRVLDPSSEIGDEIYANALASLGESREAIGKVLGEKWQKLSPEARAIIEPSDLAHLAVHFGDFTEAMTILTAAAPAVDADGDRTTHVAYVVDLARTAIESGAPKEARAAIDRYLQLAPTWSRVNLFPQLDLTGELLADAARIGAISPADLTEKRTRWLATWPARPHPYEAESWVMGWSIGTETKEEALAAIAALPVGAEIPPLLRWPTTAGAVGRTFLLASDSRAEVYLTKASKICYGLRTVNAMHARLDEATFLETKGDIAGACGQYAAILARWGNAKPRSITAEAARTRSQALRCPS